MNAMPSAAAAASAIASRRTLATRNAAWAARLARGLGQAGFRPNAVSLAGVAFAVAAGVAFVVSADAAPAVRGVALIVAAALIQLRLLCNLLDGMLAVEEGFRTSAGEIYNDLPDRIADVLILVGAGYSIRVLPIGIALGWAAAVGAVFTAYVRVLGGSLGVTQHFIGPMAKQHRMFTVTIAALLAAVESFAGLPARAMWTGLAAIVAGTVLTSWRRTLRIVREVRAR